MQRSYWTILLNSIFIMLLLSTAAMSAVPPFMNYQGRLTDAGGAPIDTTSAIIFTIYDDYIGGTPLWTETHPSVTVTDGLFSVLLGTVIQMGPNVFDGSDRFLGIRLGDGPENDPRVPIASVAHARRAEYADTAGYALASPGGSSPWTQGGGDVYLPDTMLQVAVGLTAPYPRRKLSVQSVGVGDTMALWVNNTTGIAASFYSNVGAVAVTGTKAAIYARSGGDNAAAVFHSTGNGAGVYISAVGSRDALQVQTSGTSYAGRFTGGLGVLVNGDLSIWGGFKLTTGATAGHVLTSDAAGVGTWQPSGGSSPWTLDGSDVYFSDTSFNAAVGTTSPAVGKKLTVRTTGTGTNMAFSALNTTGTAAAFFSGGDGTAFPNAPTAVYARAEGNNQAGMFKNTGNGRGITIEADGAGTALHSESFGTGYAGRFKGGLGVRVEGRLVAVTTVGYAGIFSGGDGVLVEGDLTVEDSTHMNNLTVTDDIVVGDDVVVGGKMTVGQEAVNSSIYGTVSGGLRNEVLDQYGTISGGRENIVSGGFATVGGGDHNIAANSGCVVGGGYYNKARNLGSVVCGGGSYTEADSNYADGIGAAVPGGQRNGATGDYSFAAGYRAKAMHRGTFVWAGYDYNSNFTSTNPNQFLIRAINGVGIGVTSPKGQLDVTDNADGVAIHISNADRDITWSTGQSLQFGNWNGVTFQQRMRIHSNGNVGINTTAPNYTLDVRGTIGNNTTLYHSDRRWKRNVSDLQGSLDKVMQLQGVRYEWRREQYPDMNFPEGGQIGLIAQDIEPVLPEVVCDAADGFKSIDYAKLTTLLIEAVKELKSDNDALRRRLDAVEKAGKDK